MKNVVMYTDGACSGNPGPGGYGTIVIYNNSSISMSQGYKNTTNNRMELLGVISGLEILTESCKVSVFSDSKYVVDSINKGWLYNWVNRNWRKSDNSTVKNIDLWERLLSLMKTHDVTFTWVKGHSTNELNNICDQLAVTALNSSNLADDNY